MQHLPELKRIQQLEQTTWAEGPKDILLSEFTELFGKEGSQGLAPK